MAFQTPKGRELYRAYLNQYMGPVPCTFTFVYWFGDLWMFFSQIGVIQKLCRDMSCPTLKDMLKIQLVYFCKKICFFIS